MLMIPSEHTFFIFTVVCHGCRPLLSDLWTIFDSMSATSEPWQGMPADARAVLRQQFQDQPAAKHPDRWDDLWQRDVTPWDRKSPSLALKDAIVSKSDIFGSPTSNQKRKRALIPGCGRGYDVLLLSSLGYDTYGLDVSKTAVEAARKLQAETDGSEMYAAQSPDVGRGEAKFLLNDFFKDDFLSDTDGGRFDLIFDYTFLCALPPEMRSKWARRMSDLLAPTGHLICLEWPLGKDPKDGGPPHGLSSQLYEQLFLRPGQEVSYDDQGFAISTSSEQVADGALVREARYMPERTHEAGQGKDHISIWKHRSR